MFQAIILCSLKEKQIFGPDLGARNFLWIFFSLLDVRLCRKLSLYSSSRKTCDSNSIKWRKTHFWPDLFPLDPNSGRQYFFKRTWLCQPRDIMVNYHHVQYQEKLMIRRANGQTDGQTDERDFVGRCPTNVKRPKIKQKYLEKKIHYKKCWKNKVWAKTKTPDIKLLEILM